MSDEYMYESVKALRRENELLKEENRNLLRRNLELVEKVREQDPDFQIDKTNQLTFFEEFNHA